MGWEEASRRIVEVFDRLVALGRSGVATRPVAERVVYYIVATRCEIDIDGFASVYEQDLSSLELEILIDGLHRIDEEALASEFHRGLTIVTADGFYEHLNWNKVSPPVKNEIDAIGERIGARLWELDEKLVAFLDQDASHL